MKQLSFEKFIIDLEQELGPLDTEQCIGAAALYEAWFRDDGDKFNNKITIEDQHGIHKQEEDKAREGQADMQ